jgi:F420-non-reducing hydrogenase iron-sulfur subunit
MFNMTRELVRILGVDPARLRLEWISSSEGVRFAEVARDFTRQLEELGPSSLVQAA